MKRPIHAGVVNALEVLRAQGAAFEASDDPEVVHQLRVAMRRLRVAMRLCKGGLERKREQKLSADLRWIFAKLGELRDFQVFRASLQERVVPGTPGAAALARSVEQGISQRRATLLALVRGARYRRLVEELSALVISCEAHAPGKRRILRRLRKHRRRALSALAATLHDASHIHAARKELKKLRYACDLNAPLLRKTRRRRYLKTMKQVQEQLGAVVDLSVWQRLVRKHCRGAALQDRLLAEFQREKELHAAGLAGHIEHFARASPPWR